MAYVPALIPARLTPVREATPDAFVVAVPAFVPLSVNVTVLPLTPEVPAVSVAVTAVVPPYSPAAGLTAS